MVLDDHVDVVLGAELAEPAQAVGGQLHLLVVRALGVGVDADRMAAQELRRLDPFVVVLDRLGALGFVGIAQVAFAVDMMSTFVTPLSSHRFFSSVRYVVSLALSLKNWLTYSTRVDAELVLGDDAGNRGCPSCLSLSVR